jgi:hypothetical protein
VFTAIVKGAQRREAEYLQVAVAQAWHTENFRRAGKRLKNLDYYLKKLNSEAPRRAQTAEEVFAVFESLAARGKAVQIRQR